MVSRLLVEGLGHFQFEPVKNKVAVKFMFRFLSISVGQMPERAASGSHGAPLRSVFKELPVYFPEWPHQVMCPAVWEGLAVLQVHRDTSCGFRPWCPHGHAVAGLSVGFFWSSVCPLQGDVSSRLLPIF